MHFIYMLVDGSLYNTPDPGVNRLHEVGTHAGGRVGKGYIDIRRLDVVAYHADIDPKKRPVGSCFQDKTPKDIVIQRIGRTHDLLTACQPVRKQCPGALTRIVDVVLEGHGIRMSVCHELDSILQVLSTVHAYEKGIRRRVDEEILYAHSHLFSGDKIN
jgi:hypothetical protein